VSRKSRKPPVAATPVAAEVPARNRVSLWVGLGAIVALTIGAAWWIQQRETPALPRPEPTFVGGANCTSCHAKEAQAWRGSHHDLAMQEASGAAVLGNFDNAKFTQAGITSTFFRRDDRYFVNTDGPDGRLADFEIRYTFGFQPLQQYLIEFPDGRLQALGVAWDTRPKSEGGQRWFHLYPNEKLRAGDRLHWTGIDQNWNYQCAGCHSTNLRKNYDAAADTFKTSWTDIDVNCESCHGPGSNHVAWAKQADGWQRFSGAGKGLPIALDERRGAKWTIDPGSGNAARSAPRASRREIETCGVCHARRGQFADVGIHGRPLGDTHQVATLQPDLYFPDGQMRDEVYNHGSFLQSRMNAKGVTCSDCHEPHSQKLVVPGNGVCTQCHLATKYDAASHHRHPVASKSSECVTCHMPVRRYMVVDPRHDHSMRIPRPDRAVAMGVPEPCTECHRDRKPAWAAAAIESWGGRTPEGFQRFADAFHTDDRRDADAPTRLRAVVADRTQSAMARASAIERLARWPGRSTGEILKTMLNDEDALVRAAAARAFHQVDPGDAVPVLAYRLRDPVREVRMGVARALAGAHERELAELDRTAFSAALAELVAALRFDADRPEARTNLGSLFAARGQWDAAIAELRRALELDAGYAPATINLADALRGSGDEPGAEAVLQAGLEHSPGFAALHHARGLALVRQQRKAEALLALRRASELDPSNARFGYVYAIALQDAGRTDQAIRVLEGIAAREPGDRAIREALADFERRRGNAAKAAQWAQPVHGSGDAR